MKRVLKIIGLTVLAILVGTAFEVPILYLFKISGIVGKISILIGLIVLLCLIIAIAIKRANRLAAIEELEESLNN